jgi:hypothetical protein
LINVQKLKEVLNISTYGEERILDHKLNVYLWMTGNLLSDVNDTAKFIDDWISDTSEGHYERAMEKATQTLWRKI